MQPRVVDISHHNTVADLAATAAAGVWGVIHKATQGTTYRDPNYAQRRQPATEAGMLWGAYHFGDAGDPVAQARYFLDYAQPQGDTLLVLDYEDHPSGRSKTMRPEQMIAFLREIERRTGRRAWLYSGNRIKEDLGRLSDEDRSYVRSCPLWLCQYGPQPKLPAGFDRSILWQYSDGQVGPGPHGVPGIHGQVDLNAFNGTREELEAAWHAPPDAQPAADDDPKPHRGSDDPGPSSASGDRLPPFLSNTVVTGAGGKPKNVQSVRARYDVKVEIVQQQLDKLGYHEVGLIDGRWGGKTAAAIAAFFNDRGVTGQPVIGDQLSDTLSDAVQDGWSRPVSDKRAGARPEDLAPHNDSVKMNLLQRFWAKIAAAAGALGLTGSTVSGVYSSVQDRASGLHDFFQAIPPEVWFLAMIAVSGAVWYATNRAAKSTANDYNVGRLN